MFKNKLCKTEEDFCFYMDNKKVVVPKGFQWNGASIPLIFTPFFGGRYAAKNKIPSLIHDYLISIDWDVKERDFKFYSTLIEGGRSTKVAFTMYLGVRLYSKFYYE